MKGKRCCQPVRLGDKTTPEALKRWEQEMAPKWEEAIGKPVREAYERLHRKKEREKRSPRAAMGIIEPECLADA